MVLLVCCFLFPSRAPSVSLSSFPPTSSPSPLPFSPPLPSILSPSLLSSRVKGGSPSSLTADLDAGSAIVIVGGAVRAQQRQLWEAPRRLRRGTVQGFCSEGRGGAGARRATQRPLVAAVRRVAVVCTTRTSSSHGPLLRSHRTPALVYWR